MIDFDNNKYVLGTAQFGQAYGITNQSHSIPSLDEISKILYISNKNQIDTIDTAYLYGNCHDLLGTIGVDSFNVITKLPSVEQMHDPRSFIENIVFEILNSLKIENLHGILLHFPIQLLQYNGDKIYECLKLLKSQNIVKKIGISVYCFDELINILNHFELDFVQVPFNLVDRRLVANGMLSFLKSKGLEVHVRSIFLQGVLLSQYYRNERFSKWNNCWDAFDSCLETERISDLEACLNFVSSFDKIDKILIGVGSAKQLEDILNVRIRDILFPKEIASKDMDLIDPRRW